MTRGIVGDAVVLLLYNLTGTNTMPYRRKGKVIYHRKAGSWKVKQRCSSVLNAIKAMRLLRGLEAGSIKQEDIKRYKRR
jgi:hypothetical protein